MKSRVLVFVALILVLATGQCLLDQAEHHGMDHGPTLDLCLLMVVILSISPVLLAGPLPSGWAQAFLPLVLVTAPVRVLDPPPKTGSRS